MEWNLVALIQYKAVPFNYSWYLVSIGLACLYILRKVEIWWVDTDASLTHYAQGKIGLLKLLRRRSGALVT